MKELLTQYASFNVWAHQKMLETISTLNDEQIHKEIVSSFPSIYKTVLHLLDAESIWWQRLKLQEHVERPGESFDGTFAELQKKLLQQSTLFQEWVSNATEMQLLHVFAYMRNKEQHKEQVCQMLLHLFNHNSYHRGQLVTMLRQLGVTKIHSTDFNGYLRSNKK
ncbi:MAG: DinB family protein [Chitinophagaceae bacterium]|nr:DinB family protein [Chitinophagaceae bacterium]